MSIKTVAVLGAGAVGSYFIRGLQEKYGENLWVIAQGERKRRLETEGIVINGERQKLHVKTPEEARGVDVLLVSVKYSALKSSLEAIGAAVGEHTLVFSLLNGVDSEEIIADRIGMEHMLYAVMYIASERSGNEIRFNPDTTIGLRYGEADGTMDSVHMRQAAELFAGSKARAQALSNIRQEMWYKYAFNVSYNLPQAIVNCGVGAYAASEHMAFLRRALRDEVTAVAAAEGVDISTLAPIEKVKYPSAPESRYSTLQDLDNKRRTEIDMFSGTMMRLAKKHGLDVPCSTFTYHVIRAMEERNAGKLP